MNTIKQAKHLNDQILGRYGTFRLWRSGVNNEGTYSWCATLQVNGKEYEGWGTSEEEARTNAAQKYKNGEWDYDHSRDQGVRSDNSRLATSVQIGDNLWWRVVQKPLTDGKLVVRDAKKKTITIHIQLPEPIKNILLMTEVFKFANEKIEDESLRMSEHQIEEYVKRLYPIMSYSGLWNDHIPTTDLDSFYGIVHEEEPVGV